MILISYIVWISEMPNHTTAEQHIVWMHHVLVCNWECYEFTIDNTIFGEPSLRVQCNLNEGHFYSCI